MNRIEIIRLRYSGSAEKKQITEAFRQLKSSGSEGPCAVELLRDARLETDFSIHIHWKGCTTGCLKSTLGLRLADALACFGMINHSVWVEEDIYENPGIKRDRDKIISFPFEGS